MRASSAHRARLGRADRRRSRRVAVLLCPVLVVAVTSSGSDPADAHQHRPTARATAPPVAQRPAPLTWSTPHRTGPPAPARASRLRTARPSTPAAVRVPRSAGTTCSGRGWQQRRGRAALSSLPAAVVRTTGFRLEFVAARTGVLGLTHLGQRRIELFVRTCGRESDALLRHVAAHELGHAYDAEHMTPSTRASWQQARGIPASTPWYGCWGCADFATPAGDFAEVYAQWARGASSNRSLLAGAPGPATLAALASRFFSA